MHTKSTKLFVASLTPNITDAQLKAHFSQCGAVLSARVATDRFSGKGRGFGFVEMKTSKDTDTAIKSLHNSTLGGKPISVRPERKVKNQRNNSVELGRPTHRRKWGIVL